MTTYSVLIPCYNEERAIKQTIEQIKAVMNSLKESYEIIIINDCSKDKTAHILSTITGIKVIANEQNSGYGASLKRGLKHAQGEWIIITDADGTYPIADIPKLVHDKERYDMIVGARTGNDVTVPLMRRPAKWMLGKVANFLTGKYIPDINSGLRVFKKDLAMGYYHLYPNGFSFTTTITMAALTNEYSVKYIPINYYKRKGSSTVSPFDFFNFLRIMFRLVMYFNPMKILTPLSIFFFLLGTVRAVRDVILTDAIGTFALMLFLMAFQIFILGVIADIIIKRK